MGWSLGVTKCCGPKPYSTKYFFAYPGHLPSVCSPISLLLEHVQWIFEPILTRAEVPEAGSICWLKIELEILQNHKKTSEECSVMVLTLPDKEPFQGPGPVFSLRLFVGIPFEFQGIRV